MSFGLVLFAAMAVASQGLAAEYLETIQSDVFHADGSHDLLARRAAVCLAKLSGVPGQTIQSSPADGLVVGNTLFSYSSGGIPWSVKSTLTVETKDGRFRLTHSGIVHKQGGPAIQKSWSIFSQSVDQGADGGWMRVGKWKFSPYEKVEAAAQELSKSIADCVTASGTSSW